jgi:hypothetical protein
MLQFLSSNPEVPHFSCSVYSTKSAACACPRRPGLRPSPPLRLRPSPLPTLLSTPDHQQDWIHESTAISARLMARAYMTRDSDDSRATALSESTGMHASNTQATDSDVSCWNQPVFTHFQITWVIRTILPVWQYKMHYCIQPDNTWQYTDWIVEIGMTIQCNNQQYKTML